MTSQFRQHLDFLYGREGAAASMRQLSVLLKSWPRLTPGRFRRAVKPLAEHDILLITYADQLREPGEAPLRTLARFCKSHLRDLVSGVHILPFYPASSDDGFAVKDYFAVDPAFGSWNDVAHLGQSFDLMFDAVVNHLSAQGEWFRRFQRDDPQFRDFFITVKGQPDLSQVVRPRTLPLLTEFPTARGRRRLWTTFSADQVDRIGSAAVLRGTRGAVHPAGCHRFSLEGNRNNLPAPATNTRNRPAYAGGIG